MLICQLDVDMVIELTFIALPSFKATGTIVILPVLLRVSAMFSSAVEGLLVFYSSFIKNALYCGVNTATQSSEIWYSRLPLPFWRLTQ
ncbi:hypothetical protein ACU8KH_04165 [Lachancea thermotolerans]